MFADLSGFTTLSERLDPEDIRAFQNALFEMLARTIGRYGGFVEKFVGDAVLAAFGAPTAHEDDPIRTCVTAAPHGLVRHRFACEPAGELALRGKTEAIIAHRLLGALAEPTSPRGLEVQPDDGGDIPAKAHDVCHRAAVDPDALLVLPFRC